VSRTVRIRPNGAALLVGAMIGTAALAGCGAGQEAQTAYQVNASGGATVTTPTILLRDAQIAFGTQVEGAAVWPLGGSAPVEMYVINQGDDTDRLVSASSPIAASVQVSGATDLPEGTVLVIGAANTGLAGESVPTAPATNQAPVNQPTAAPTAPAEEAEPDAPAASLAPVPGEEPAEGIQTPPSLGPLAPGARQGEVVLTGLREEIRAGLSYPLVLNFERAGAISVDLPVAYPSQPREEPQEAE
jgi:copper(I)-binding protein